MISRKQQESMSLGKFRFKIFLCTGVLFGIFMGLFHPISDGLVEPVVWGLVSGSLFGVMMAFITGFRQRNAAKKYGWAEGEVPAVNQRCDVDVALAPDAAFELAERAVAALPAKVIARDTSTRSIQATTGMSRQSWGERLSVRVEPRPAGSVVVIGSRPRFPLTVADYGKNRVNVESIANRLQVV
jgi:F0F1-type ATP synthase assembly protein I